MFSSTRICTSRAVGTFWKDLFVKAWKMDRLGYLNRKCYLNTLTSDRKFPKKTRIKRNKISFEAISGNEDIFGL